MAPSVQQLDRPRPSRGVVRFNAWITALLLGVVFVLVNALAREHLDVRRDLSEDQLYSLHPAVHSLLGELEDVLRVDAYFTGEAQHGPVQIAKGRLVDMLHELENLAGNRLDVRFHDPNTSTEARLAADRLGILPQELEAIAGTDAVRQRVWLGLVLRYRGREHVLPWVLPQGFEYGFAYGLRQLVREERPTVGFLRDDEDVGDGRPFSHARELLRTAYRVTEVGDLAEGASVPDGIDVLVVARPRGLHPRVVFALDQYLQRGGRMLVAVDRQEIHLETGEVAPLEPGLDALFAAWGLRLTHFLVWDKSSVNVNLPGPDGGRATSVQYPYFVRVETAQLSTELPPMAALEGFNLFWGHAFESAVELPPGVAHDVLATSSERSWLVPELTEFHLDYAVLNAMGAELSARGDAAALPLAVAVSGPLPSPFAPRGGATDSRGAPGVRDPIEHALWRDRARAAREAGAPVPRLEVGRTDEPVLSAAARAQVVVVGDADWLRDGNFFGRDNQLLLANLVDWLGLEEDLLALRSRMPRQRTIDDFLAEEQEARGLTALRGSLSPDEEQELAARAEEARRAAAARRRLRMAWATGGSLGAIALFVAAARALLRRPVPGARQPGAGTHARSEKSAAPGGPA